MALDTHLSIIASALLAVAWVVGAKSAPDEAPSFIWKFLLALRSANQVFPTILVFMVGASWIGTLSAALSLGITDSGSDWLGEGELELWRRWALLAAMAIWRAEKLESLLQRMQRCAGVWQRTSFGEVCSASANDPSGWIWTPAWAIGRRVALVTVSSFGCTPFVLKALPAVVMDEFLWWALAMIQSSLSKAKLNMPPVIENVLLPLLDTLHFVPVLVRIFMLGVIDYPLSGAGEVPRLVLVASSLAWSGHNCHMLYQAVCDIMKECQGG